MTSSDQPDRPTAAGVFVVRDPAVCAALEQLLEPHRTDRTPAPSGGDGLMDRARAHLALLEVPVADDATIEGALDHVYTAAHNAGRAQATAEGREWSESMQERARRADSAVAHAERDLDHANMQLQAALAKIAKLEANPAGRRPTVSALRLKDQEAFATLADRMDREAHSQTKTAAAVLRLASKSVRDEIAIVYGNADRSAS